MDIVGLLFDEISKFFHKPFKCDGCPYFNIICQIRNCQGITKKWVWSFLVTCYYMIISDQKCFLEHVFEGNLKAKMFV